MLSREDAGAERIFQNNGVPLLLNMIETGKPEMILAAIRTLSGMCTGHKARVSMLLESRQIKSERDHVVNNAKCTTSIYMMPLEINLTYLCLIFSHKMYLVYISFDYPYTGNGHCSHGGH